MLFGMSVSAQCEDFSRADKSEYLDADFFFYQARFAEANSILLGLHKTYPKNPEVSFRLAVCQIETSGDKELASDMLNLLLQSGNKESLFHLGKLAHLNYKFIEAISFYNEYANLEERELSDQVIKRHIKIAELAQELTDKPEDVLVKNLGAEVNSKFAEYIPVITPDEKEMYFTSRRENSTGGRLDPNKEFFEDIYYTKKLNGVWSEPTNNISDINTPTHDATAAIAADGNAMVIYRTNRQLTGGDLYITKKLNDKWTEPKILDENINSEFQEASACFSPDGETIIFSSNRPDGYGGKDLYRVKLLPNGEWSLPKNLGSSINTEYNEDSPFLDIDGRTLYFASEGHNGMGGFDIFSTKKVGEEHWKIPENLGFPANSVEDDIYLSITPGGRKGYYSSVKEDGYGGQDLYEIDFIYRQKTNLIIKGWLVDGNGSPVHGEITIIDERNKELQGVYKSNKISGKYLLVLHPLVNYKMIVASGDKEVITKDLFFEFPDENNAEINLQEIVLN
jgi:hypothetical protein